jgi:sugar lactone lactonase YvrE
MKTLPSLVSLLLMLCLRVQAQIYDTNNPVVETFAGSGFYGYYDGQGVFTMFNSPTAIVSDSSSNLFVLDLQNSLIRKITPDATVSTYFNLSPYSAVAPMTIDHSNALYIATQQGSLVRVSSNSVLSQINLPFNSYFAVGGLCVDSANSLYVSDSYGNRIYRQSTNGVWEIFAGSGNPGSIDGNWIFTSFNGPHALTADGANNIYVWDSYGRIIRRINQNRDVVTIAGSNFAYQDLDGVGLSAGFNVVLDMHADNDGNLILACGSSVRKVTPTTNVVTIAGAFDQMGYTNGPGPLARFRNAAGVCPTRGMIFVADANDHRIRQITFNATAQPVTGANLSFIMFPGLEINGIVGRSYRIESSTNLSYWITEDTVLLTSNPYLWIDRNGAGQKKFYRAFLLP